MLLDDMEDSFSDINQQDSGESDESDKREFEDDPDDDDERYDEDEESGEGKSDSGSDNEDDFLAAYSLDKVHDKVNDELKKKRDEEGEVVEVVSHELADPIEGLGDDFEETPWVPPTIELAWEHKLKKLYHGGTQKLSQIDLSKASDLGLAIPMYFTFLKVMCYALFLMSICSIPGIAFSYFGHKVPEEGRDFIGLYKTTIGNIGHNDDSATYEEDSKCTVAKRDGAMCTDIMGVEFTMSNVATILCGCEILQILVFLLAVRILKNRCAKLREKSDARSCTISDYSIMVENIPKDATSEELTQFFSELYPLDKPDWKGRPPVEGAQPLQHCDNTGKEYYVNTWVAETVIYQALSQLIAAFKAKQSYMKNLQRARAKMKMYKEDTCHAHGPNPRRYAKAENEMLYYGTKLDELTNKTLKQAKSKMRLQSQNGKKLNVTNGLIKADSHAAFVTFNYSESKARCIEDYRMYDSMFYRFFMPSCLKFKGKKLRVSPGPEPDEVLWENVEVAEWRKFLHRQWTAIVAIMLLLLGFVVILQASLKKEQFNNDVPQLNVCELELPAIYAGTYNIPGGTTFIRPDVSKNELGLGRAEYDAFCKQVVPGSFYAVYSTNGQFDTEEDLLAEYDEEACQSSFYDNDVTTDCPLYNSSAFCPCVSHSSSDKCSTLSCSVDGTGHSCTDFQSSTIAGCYCYEELLSLFTTSFSDFLSRVAEADDACNVFFVGYALAVSLSLLASLCTVIINVGLRVTMRVLGKQECHNTIDDEQRAITVKTFASIYINTAFVALLAFGSLKNKPEYFGQAQVLDGEYDDFDAAWYAQVGSLLLFTFILQALGPLNFKWFKVHVFTPCRMRCAHPKIVSQSSHKYAMQSDVDSLELGGVFDTTQHTAQLLALLFFTMTYGAGLPLLVPMLTITFVIYYRADKRLLCRHYEKPPKIGDAIMQFVLNVLPWAAVVRLCVTCWMYSNEFVFPQTRLTLESIPEVMSVDWKMVSDNYNSWVEDQEGRSLVFGLNAGHRLTRGNVFPLFVLLVIIVVLEFGGPLLRYSPLHALYHFMRIISTCFSHCCRRHCSCLCNCLCCGGKRKHSVKGIELMGMKDPLRAETAPYTGDYFHYARSEYIKQKGCCKGLRHLVTDELTESEIEAGWRMTYIGEHKVKMITWENNTRVNGVFRRKGSTQRTYEVVGQYGCWSYELHRIPHYRSIMMAIQEGMESILQDIEHDKDGAGESDLRKKSDASATEGDDHYKSATKRLSVVDKYKQRHLEKQQSIAETKKANKKKWTKTLDKKSSKVYADSADVYGEPDVEFSSDSDSGESGLV